MTNFKMRLLATTVVAGVAAAATPVLAQNASQPGQQPTAPTVGGSSTAALPSGQQGTANPDRRTRRAAKSSSPDRASPTPTRPPPARSP